MGYSTFHKGHKCLDLSTGRIYTSRDVFDKLVFPFSTLNPNEGPTLRTEAALHPTLFPDLSLGSQSTGDHVANFPLAFDHIYSSYPMQQPQENKEDWGAGRRSHARINFEPCANHWQSSLPAIKHIPRQSLAIKSPSNQAQTV
jgi:hypothetical protein